jgi:putative chitinase
MINRQIFYTRFKTNIQPRFTNSQLQGFEAIFNEWDRLKLTDIRHLAYMLATAWHETAKTMQPIEEYGKGKTKPYGKRIRQDGKPYTDTNQIFYGRGFVQLTWYENYKRAGIKLGVDFIKNAALVMQMDNSVKIMFSGMMFGWFTGRKLSDYFNGDVSDPINARRIINGKDCADLIADYHNKFMLCLDTP